MQCNVILIMGLIEDHSVLVSLVHHQQQADVEEYESHTGDDVDGGDVHPCYPSVHVALFKVTGHESVEGWATIAGMDGFDAPAEEARYIGEAHDDHDDEHCTSRHLFCAEFFGLEWELDTDPALYSEGDCDPHTGVGKHVGDGQEDEAVKHLKWEDIVKSMNICNKFGLQVFHDPW